jgi:hypothetical protein
VTGRPVRIYIKELDDSSGIVAEVRRLAALDQVCGSVLPPSLRPFATVGAYRNGRIKIYATSGGVAAKLRQIAPRLSNELRKRGLEVTGIDFQVQAGIGKTPNVAGPQRTLSDEAISDLEALRDRLAPGPLRESIDNLLSRAIKTENGNF